MHDVLRVRFGIDIRGNPRPQRTYPVAAQVIRISGEPTPEENMAAQSRLEFYKRQLRHVIEELCALMPKERAKPFLELLISNLIEDHYK